MLEMLVPVKPLVPLRPPVFGAFAVNSGTSLQLNWTNADSSYTTEIWRDGTLLATAAAAVITYADTGLSAGTNYSYKLRHRKLTQYSPFTAPQIDYTAPAPPTSLTATPSNSTMILNWSDPNVSLRTNIYSGGYVASVGVGVMTYNHTGLADGSHSYTVRATDGVYPLGNESADSNTATATIDTTVHAPTSLTVNISTSTGQLAWTNYNGTLQIRVYRGGSLVTTLAAATTSYNDTSLANGAYTWTVRHWNGTTESVDSNTASGTVSVANITAPSGLTALSPSYYDQVNLAWTNGDASRHTEIYVDTGSGFTLVTTANPGVASYTNDDLTTTGQSRTYKVRHYDSPSFSNYSATAAKTTNTPTLSSVALTPVPGSDKITLTWTLTNPPYPTGSAEIDLFSLSDTTGLYPGQSIVFAVSSPYDIDISSFYHIPVKTTGFPTATFTVNQLVVKDRHGTYVVEQDSITSASYAFDGSP